jgi:pyruvate ferredoxin oxidoreductase gamma subunit
MMGALVKVSKMLEIEAMLKDTEVKLKKKFASKPEVIKGNLEAIKKAYEEVISE